MKFSIIIPVYNVEKYLEKCLQSVINQTYKNFEAIIVCDKSADKSEEIVDKYVKKYDCFKKIYEENTGLSKAKNIGVKVSNGDYILFLDGDDFYNIKLLEILNSNLLDKPDILRFQVQEVYENNIIKYKEKEFDNTNGQDAFEKIIKYHYVENSWCYAYKKTFWKKNKFLFMENCIAEDYGLTPLIIAKASKVKSISFIGYNYVQRENSLMSNPRYENKIKKMEDMILQGKRLYNELNNIKNPVLFLRFINDSLIYYSTTLKYKDFKKYHKIFKKLKVYDYLLNRTIKNKIKKFLIKSNAYIYYNYLMR